MIAGRQILERRLLASLGQAVAVALPPSWRDLRPSSPNLRSAATVLLRIAAAPNRAEMARALRDTADRVTRNREGRGGGERDLWPRVAAAVESLEETREGPGGLFGLRLWSDVEGVPLQDLWESLGQQVPADRAAPEPFLTAAARVLLHALGRSWVEEAEKARRQAS